MATGTVTTPAAGALDAPEKVSARERLLAAANELFYAEGVNTVGIDRVIEHAGVAKATLYSAFGSKDELIRAYLTLRYQRIRERMEGELATRFTTPRDKLVGVFTVQGDTFTRPGLRGCAFIRANAEARPGGPIEQVSEEYRGWLKQLFIDLARDAGAAQPETLAQQLQLLYDGVGISTWLDRDHTSTLAATAVAAALVDAALA